MSEKVLAVVAVLALLLAGAAALKPTNISVPDVNVTVDTNALANLLDNKLGAVAGPVLNAPSFTVNGAKEHYFSDEFKTSSTTVCSFRTPSSTSTLLYASMSINTATSNALVWEWGKSRFFDATTTSLLPAPNYVSVAANARGSLVIASTTDMIDAPAVIAPRNYVNLKYGGMGGAISSAGNGLAGTCKVKLLEN